MIHAILASWLLTQQWSWDKPPAEQQVQFFRIYWSATGTSWCINDRVELDAATHCGTVNHCQSDQECCGDIPIPNANLAFIMVTAVNARGESGTDHGPIGVCP